MYTVLGYDSARLNHCVVPTAKRKKKRGYRTRNISDVSQDFLNNVESMGLGRKRGGFVGREKVCFPTES